MTEKWLAAAAGEDRPSPLTWGAAVDCLDGLIADGLVVETATPGQPTDPANVSIGPESDVPS